MSKEQLKEFLENVKGETSLQEQLKTEGSDVVAIAKSTGCIITEAEVNAWLACLLIANRDLGSRAIRNHLRRKLLSNGTRVL